MSAVGFVVCMIVIPGLLFAAVSNYKLIKNSKDMGTKRLVYCKVASNTAFCILCFLFVSSLIKAITGKGRLSYVESLDYIVNSTFLHYLLIDIVILIGMAGLFWVFTESRWFNITGYTIKIFCSLFVVMFCFWGQLPNIRLFVIEFVLAIVGALGIVLCKKDDVIDYSQMAIKKRTAETVPIFVFWFVVNFYYMPSELYLSNVDDIRLRYGMFLMSCIVMGALAILLLSAASIFVLSDVLRDMTIIGVFATALMNYLQHMFLNGEMRNMDGTLQKWSTFRIVFNIAIWIAAFAVLYLIFFYKKAALKVYRSVAIAISALLVITVGVLTFTTQQNSSDTLTCQGTLDISDKSNVLVFVLDWYDTQFVDKITAEDPQFFYELSDFTYYDNAVSMYPYTGKALPYLLTGTKWKPGVMFDNIGYVDYAYSQSKWLSDIKAQGYSVGVYTEPAMVDRSQKTVIMNYNDHPEQNFSITECAGLALKSSRYLGMPFIYKNRFLFNTYDYMNLLHDDDGWRFNDDSVFYDGLINQGLAVNDTSAKGAFRFYHMYGAHSPFNLTENCEPIKESYINIDPEMSVSQAKGTMRIVFEYLAQLKKLGKYDDATIIITADHGQNYIFEDDYESLLMQAELDKPSSPIVFVKRPHEKSTAGEVRRDDTPISQDDIRDIIDMAVGVDEEKGDSKESTSANGVRILTNVLGENRWREYSINGNVHDWANWSMKEYESNE